MNNIYIAIKSIKEMYAKETGVTNMVIRPLFPRDLGKDQWVWDKENQVTVSDLVRLLIYGIWCKELIEIHIKVSGTTVVILTTGTILSNEFPTFGPNTLIDITPRYLITCDKKIEFSLIGYAIEPAGRRIKPSYTTILVKEEK